MQRRAARPARARLQPQILGHGPGPAGHYLLLWSRASMSFTCICSSSHRRSQAHRHCHCVTSASVTHHTHRLGGSTVYIRSRDFTDVQVQAALLSSVLSATDQALAVTSYKLQPMSDVTVTMQWALQLLAACCHRSEVLALNYYLDSESDVQ